MASRESIWSGVRSGLTYEQNALLRAYGAATYEERERALDQIARDIADRVDALEARRPSPCIVDQLEEGR